MTFIVTVLSKGGAMKISKIKLQKHISPQIIQHVQHEARDFYLEDEEGNYLCNLEQFLNEVNKKLNIINDIKLEEKKLEPSGAV